MIYAYIIYLAKLFQSTLPLVLEKLTNFTPAPTKAKYLNNSVNTVEGNNSATKNGNTVPRFARTSLRSDSLRSIRYTAP